jgi:hypothetical protein
MPVIFGVSKSNRRNIMAQIIIGKKSNVHEYPFKDEVHDMADFVLEHPQTLGSDISIVCRELQVGTSNESRRIDFLVYDTGLNQVGIVELKNKIADEKVLLQTLRYANWIRNNPDTVRYQIKKQDLNIDAEEIDAENIKVLIVAPKITQSLSELCQYITSFDFEFIELQRFKDENGEIYAVTNTLEIETPEPIPSKPRGEYDLAWFQANGLKSKQAENLSEAINKIQAIISENEWELNLRYVKWAVRFQIASGHNAFYIGVRKTQNHILRIPLGPDLKIESLQLKPEVKKSIKHTNPSSRWWYLPLDIKEINEYIPLLNAGYQTVMK